MSQSIPESPFHNDEFARIFEQYRTRIEEITRQAGNGMENLRPLTFEGSSENRDETAVDTKPIKNILAPAIPSREITPSQAFVKESEKIVNDARKQAKKILQEAEEQVKKEAKKKTRAEVDKLISVAHQEAETLVTETKRIVEQEREAAITATKAQMESILAQVTEEARRDAAHQSLAIINDARERAEKLTADIARSGAEISDLIGATLDRMKNNIQELETKLQEENGALSRAIAETRMKVERLAEETMINKPAKVQKSNATPVNPRISVHVLGDRSNGKNGTQPLFFGQIEVRADAESMDYSCFKNLKKYLGRVPGMKQLQESASEKEITALYDITEPLPLAEVLGRMPLVAEVTPDDDRNFSIVFSR